MPTDAISIAIDITITCLLTFAITTPFYRASLRRDKTGGVTAVPFYLYIALKSVFSAGWALLRPTRRFASACAGHGKLRLKIVVQATIKKRPLDMLKMALVGRFMVKCSYPVQEITVKYVYYLPK